MNHSEGIQEVDTEEGLFNPLDGILVGNDDCPIDEIVTILKPTEWTDSIQKAIQIAGKLGIKKDKRDRLRRNYESGIISIEDLIDEVLITWRSQEATKATVAALAGCLEACGLKDVADRLQKRYGKPKKPDALKIKIYNRHRFLYASLLTMSLRVIFVALWLHLAAEQPLHKATLPPPPFLYISRNLSTYVYFSDNVLEIAGFTNDDDIFVVSNIEDQRVKLSCSGKFRGSDRCRRTDLVANQLEDDSVTVGHLILRHKDEFSKLCFKTNRPIHWLEYNSSRDMFKWIKSRGKMSALQRNFVDKQGMLQNEAELISSLNNNHVIISGEPGIGKTTFLVNLGHMLKKLGHPVIFFNATELRMDIKHMRLDNEQHMHTFLSVIGNHTCVNAPCKEQLTSLIFNGNTRINILVDGYDILSHDERLLLDLYLRSMSALNTIRFFVTTRPYHLTHLENVLETIGHKILPFTMNDQLTFLRLHWSSGRDYLDLKRLHVFAEVCMDSVNAAISEKERSLTGIALLCLMIAEIYEDDAISYSNLDNVVPSSLHSPPKIKVVSSIFKLFTKLVNRKLEIYGNITTSEKSAILYGHSYQAINSMFPKTNLLDVVSSKLNHSKPIDILKLGILDNSPESRSLMGFSFLHQAFAEYFVAWFILDTLENDSNFSHSHANIFLNEMLKTLTFDAAHSTTKVWNFEVECPHIFKHKRVLQFFNSGLKSWKTLQKVAHQNNHQLWSSELDYYLNEKLAACVHSDMTYVLKFLFLTFKDITITQFDYQNLLSCAVLYSSVSTVEIIKQLDYTTSIKSVISYDPLYIKSLWKKNLQVAASRGDYKMFEYIWIANFLIVYDTNCLIHVCLRHSQNNSEEAILEKIQIIKYLAHYPGEFILDEMHPQDCPHAPLLSESVHHQLLLEVLEHGVNYMLTTYSNKTVLHVVAETHSAEDFHAIFSKITEKNSTSMSTLVLTSDGSGNTPLHVVIKNFEPLDSTLEMFSNAGADFNSEDSNGHTIHLSAVESTRSTTFLKRLIEHGARPDETVVKLPGHPQICHFAPSVPVVCNDPDQQCEPIPPPRLHCPEVPKEETVSPLHEAVARGNYQAVKFLLSVGLNASTPTYPGNVTPLQIAISVNWRGSHVPIMKVLIEYGANVDEALDNILNERGPSPEREVIFLLIKHSTKYG